MTPISTTTERLILRSRPWVLGLGVICAILIFAGIALHEVMKNDLEAAKGPLIMLVLFVLVFAVFVRQEVVVFDRAAGLIHIRRVTVLGAGEVQHPLAGLLRAEAERDTSDSSGSLFASGSHQKMFRPVLIYDGKGRVPLSGIYQSGPDAKTTADAINAWLKRKG